MQKGREYPQKEYIKMNTDLQNNNKDVCAFEQPALPLPEIPIDTLHARPTLTPRSFSVLLCPASCQERDHSGHPGSLASGLCGWVWLMAGPGEDGGGIFFPAPSNSGCWVSGNTQLLRGGPLSMLLLSGGSGGTIFPFGFLLLTVPGCLSIRWWLPNSAHISVKSLFHNSRSFNLLSFRTVSFQNPGWCRFKFHWLHQSNVCNSETLETA